MSCDWDIECRTCTNETGIDLPNSPAGVFHSVGFCDFNHEDQTMVALLLARPELEALGKVWSKVDAYPGAFTDKFRAGYVLKVATFFAAHVGHELVPRNEYGRWIDQCDQYAGAACKLKLNHEGECKP